MTKPLCVVPDIHGSKDKLDQGLASIAAWEGQETPIVFLGDYVDRGPNSRGVIQTLIEGLDAGREWTALRGNHDQMFLDAIEGRMGPGEFESWCSETMGGRATLTSYGVDTVTYGTNWRGRVPEAHKRFLEGLPHIHETSDLFLCHAGVLPGVPLDEQDPHDLMWMREPFLSDRRDHGKLVVHGHTPVEAPEHHGNRVALDCGAGWGRDLIVAVFEGRDAWVLTDKGRVPLKPQDAD